MTYEELMKDIENRFTYHPINHEQAERCKEIGEQILSLAKLIGVLTPYSKEQSTALTLLQQVRTMSNAAIAINEVNNGTSRGTP
jgi:superfamily I DNA and/or RNA helicase